MDPVPGVEPTASGYYLWRYVPNPGAAILFLVLFIGTTVYNSWRMVRARTWFCSVFVIGGLFEVIGYGIRSTSHNQTAKLMPYVIQNALILLAPALFSASIYMILSRIIRSVRAEKYSFIRPTRLTKTFVTGDVICFLLQGGASGLLATGNPDLSTWGERTVIAGLVIQIILFGAFVLTAVVFHRRIYLYPTPTSFDESIPWRKCLLMLYAASTLVIIRSVFRIVEYVFGNEGYPLSHEWMMYVFDSLLMFIVTLLFAVQFPSNLQPPSDLRPRESFEL
ncbi:RTA1 like protein-domain-containing protein [Xylariaceae sp. FL0662B]|nr:RTA1 like protein-domain-containing protein [Xylariaceae sp. FL0662B]